MYTFKRIHWSFLLILFGFDLNFKLYADFQVAKSYADSNKYNLRSEKFITKLTSNIDKNVATSHMYESQLGPRIRPIKEPLKIIRKIESNTKLQAEMKLKRNRTISADMLSHNISMILENLLKRYEQSQLPTHGQGVPTIVRTNILIRSMGPISELDMEYSMDCYFRQYWRDKRLSFHGPVKTLSLSIKMLDKIWRPDTYFFNGKHSHIHTLTVPNKLLRLDQDGGILYSMRLTIKATCPMELKSFPIDRQSCPLIIGSYSYTSGQLTYEWQNSGDKAVTFVRGMTLNQFDLVSMRSRNLTYSRREGEFSILHVAFNLKRHTGYFLIQVYVPCILIVVLSWVSFWIHREATSDRVSLCVTSVLTLSTISIDSRNDLPKVKYATALDWFLLMSFLYCIATLLEFAGVHYFTKIGSGELFLLSEENEWEDMDEEIIHQSLNDNHNNNYDANTSFNDDHVNIENNKEIVTALNDPINSIEASNQRSSSQDLNSPIPSSKFSSTFHNSINAINQETQLSHTFTTMERTTQTESLPIHSKIKQIWLCLIGDEKFRKQREKNAAANKNFYSVNSVSEIDRISRIAFPISFTLFNLLYWIAYGMFKEEFTWATIRA